MHWYTKLLQQNPCKYACFCFWFERGGYSNIIETRSPIISANVQTDRVSEMGVVEKRSYARLSLRLVSGGSIHCNSPWCPWVTYHSMKKSTRYHRVSVPYRLHVDTFAFEWSARANILPYRLPKSCWEVARTAESIQLPMATTYYFPILIW